MAGCLTRHLLCIHYSQTLRTVGSQMAKLLMALYDSGLTTFTSSDAVRITGLSPSHASSLLHKASKRGLVAKLKRGLFVIVPPELGSSIEYSGNPYLVARYLAGSVPYFVSHASAMELHRMVTQPQLTVFVSSTKRILNQKIRGTQFRFVLLQAAQYFGNAKIWVTKQEPVEVSDLERTVVDGLRQPEYCGGVTEVAKGLWIRRNDMSVTRLVEYALRLNTEAVMRRLGFLLDVYDLGTEAERASLRKHATA